MLCIPHTYAKVYKSVFHAVLLMSSLDAKVLLHWVVPFHFRRMFLSSLLSSPLFFRLLISVLLGLWNRLALQQTLVEHMLGWLQRYVAWFLFLFFIQILCKFYVIYTQDEQIALASVKCTLDTFNNIINKVFKRRKGETVVNVLRQLVP